MTATFAQSTALRDGTSDSRSAEEATGAEKVIGVEELVGTAESRQPALSLPYALPGRARGAHLRGLKDLGARDVSLPAMQRARQAIDAAVTLGEAAALFGDPGHGKTFAAQYWRSELESGKPWFVAPRSASTKRFTIELLSVLTGHRHLDLRESEAAHMVQDELDHEFLTLFVDEAQRMSQAQLDVLRGFHDNSASEFALVLLGGHGCARALASQPELDDRIALRVYFERLAEHELRPFLASLHPVFANTDPELIFAIDSKYALGKPRRWARMLQFGLDWVEASDVQDRFTPATVQFTLQQIRGTGLEGKAGRPFTPRGGNR